MGLLEIINEYLNILFIATFFLLVIVGGAVYYLIKVKKVTAKEEKIDYSHFNRKDAMEFTKFDNVISSTGGPGGSEFGIMIVDEKTFIAILDVKGYNFATASPEERKNTIINSVAMFNTVERPIIMRQMTKAIDVSYNMKKQEIVCKDIDDRIKALNAEYEDTEILLNCADYTDEVRGSVEKRLEDINEELQSLNWQSAEAKEILRHLTKITTSGNAEKANQLTFSYRFNPNDFVEEMTQEEIYLKASSELALMANNYINALANCGCTCRLLTGMEMLDLTRRHYHPVTADEVKTVDLFNNNYDVLFIRSDELVAVERARVGEAEYERRMDEIRKNNMIRQATLREQFETFKTKLTDSVEGYVANENVEGVQA